MKDIFEYIHSRHEGNETQKRKAADLVEKLYFQQIKPLFKMLRYSNEARIVNDLLNLESIVEKNDGETGKIKTKFIKEKLSELKINSELNEYEINLIKTNILAEYRYFVTAVFIADVVNKESRKDNLRFLISSILILLTILASVLSALLGWDWLTRFIELYFREPYFY